MSAVHPVRASIQSLELPSRTIADPAGPGSAAIIPKNCSLVRESCQSGRRSAGISKLMVFQENLNHSSFHSNAMAPS